MFSVKLATHTDLSVNGNDRKGHRVYVPPAGLLHIVLRFPVYFMFQHLIGVIWFYGLHGSLQRDAAFYSENEYDWKVWVCTGRGRLLHQSGRPE